MSPLRSATAVQNASRSPLRPILLRRFVGLLERGQFLFPLGGGGGFAPGVVELHQPFEGFPDRVLSACYETAATLPDGSGRRIQLVTGSKSAIELAPKLRLFPPKSAF